MGRFLLPMTGLHNVENATGAAAIALHLGVSAKELAAGLETFAGVRRRQELVTRSAGVVLMDDFAHHPTAVSQTLHGVAARFAGRRVWALFEPRSNTASRDIHQQEYETAFDHAHEVVLATPRKIANVSEDDRLDVEALASRLNDGKRRARVVEKAEDIARLVLSEVRPGDVVLVMSNGAFGGLVGMLKEGLEARDSDFDLNGTDRGSAFSGEQAGDGASGRAAAGSEP